jgi:hypothetical protein
LSGQFLNKWSVSAHICYFPNSIDNYMLRGGEAMKIPAKIHGTIGLSSDYSRKAAFSVNTFYEAGNNKSLKDYYINSSFTYQPFNILKFSLSLNYTVNQNELQYVGKMNSSYFLGKIDQQTLSATFRIDYNINPELSVQYYGSPFISTGSFSNFKWVNNPKAETYENRFIILNPILSSENKYVTSDGFTFSNPDFNFTQFRSNLVFRWEYLPGSKLYFVWSNEQTLYQSVSSKKIKDAFSGFGSAISKNIFLVKLNYWFSL